MNYQPRNEELLSVFATVYLVVASLWETRCLVHLHDPANGRTPPPPLVNSGVTRTTSHLLQSPNQWQSAPEFCTPPLHGGLGGRRSGQGGGLSPLQQHRFHVREGGRLLPAAVPPRLLSCGRKGGWWGKGGSNVFPQMRLEFCLKGRVAPLVAFAFLPAPSQRILQTGWGGGGVPVVVHPCMHEDQCPRVQGTKAMDHSRGLGTLWTASI